MDTVSFRQQVWFSLPAEFSPVDGKLDNSGTPDSYSGQDFSPKEFYSLQASLSDGSSLSQYSLSDLQGSSLGEHRLSEYSLRPSMEANPNSETVSTNESPDISTSQQESLTSDGQYGYDDANSTSSIHDEAVSSAIMEISGELMLGKFTTHHPGSGDSESSDISDYDGRRPPSGGAIAKYPESSTGLSDNDWNPYATESDTNQTPRSPRSVASDERVGFVSKATFNIAQPKDTTATVFMTTGEVNVKESNPERVVSSDKETKSYDDGRRNGKNGSDRLDILRYVMDDDDIDGPDSSKLATEGRNMRKDVRSPEDDVRRDSPDIARSGFTEDSRSVRQSADSGQSLDTVRRESTEFDQASRSQTLGSTSGRPSSEFDMDEYRRESGESARSFQGEGSGIRSGRQSTESGKSGRSSKSDLDRSGESGMSGRQSADSHNSGQSGRSAGSQKSTERSAESDRSARLDRLSNSAGENLKELMQFESAQRALMNSEKNKNTDQESKDEGRSQREDSGVSRTRLTARLEPYNIPVRSSKSPERSSNVGSSGYISVAERERLLTDSPDASQQVGKSYEQKQEQRSGQWSADHDRPRPEHAGINLPKFGGSLQDSETSMKRVSSLFEETKRQAREAVALRRPDPSGSEERFPLRERLTWPKHDESFKAHDRLDQLEKGVRGLEKSRDSEAARSLNSEEVARVLGKYATDDTDYPRKKDNAVNDRQENEYGSAFDRIAESGQRPRKSNGYLENSDNIRVGEMSDDDISKRVKALLTETSHLGVLRDQGGERKRTEYIPRTIDYSRLQQDLQEIQDSLQDVPPPAANDSIHVQRRNLREGLNRDEMAREEARSLESTGTTTGRESGVSEYGRRLLWDHGADLEYDQGYGGQFMGTRTSTETLSSRLRASGETDTLVVRPDSAMTNDTEYDAPELEGTRSLAGSKTLTGSDIARAEKLVEQVMNRRPEGDLKESVEDIIARYRNERKDMFDRLQAPAKPQVRQAEPDIEIKMEREKKVLKPILKDPDVVLADKNNKQGQQNGRKEPGLAERVFKILTSEQDKKNDSETSEDKGMAKKVYKILASDRPRDQVNGILSETMEKEHEMLKKLITRPKEDSSMEDSGVNETVESFEEQDVKKQLEWSKYSSPGKGDKSEFTALREVTSAPYSALSNAKSLLSTQLKKMSERNFDKSVELRTPYRQAITCYPVYGAERTRQEDQEPSVREAWMPVRRSAMSIRDRALASERFYLTEKDTGSQHVEGPQLRGRTYSDPFDVSFSKRTADYRGEGHTRSRSEEAGAVSDLSQHSFSELECSPERMTAGSPRSKIPGSLSTPKKHRPQEWSYECYTSISDSSDPHHHSDSSDGHMLHYHGYQLHNTLQDPEDDLFVPNRPGSPVKNSTRSTFRNEIHNEVVEESKLISKSMNNPRKGRSRIKMGQKQMVKFQGHHQMSRSLPNYYPNTGFVENVPISSNDVYELLTRSQQQEAKLAELQQRLLGKQEVSQDSSSSSSQSPPSFRGQGHIGNHGNKIYGQMKSTVKKDLSMRPGYYRGDGSPSPTESDTSGSRKGNRLRPYRPAGSRDMYYTESGDDTNESGTTIESTHPGSDDAAPPYIPSQFLGSRRDEPVIHSKGIYGNREKDDLSTIDENSVKDDKEKALSASVGSGKEGTVSDKRSIVTADTGYQTGTVRSRSPASLKDDLQLHNKGQATGVTERPGFKTREEFQRDFEKRERELKELLSKHRKQEMQRDSLGASTRSDPGGMVEDQDTRWEYRQSDQMNEFHALEPEPAYPEERLRYSRSRSDTDLVALSPTESQKYSSPVQPGRRFLEFSTQQSPIFAHHDSITHQSRGVPGGVPPELPRVPAEREMRERVVPPPKELPKVYDRKPVLSAKDLPSSTERRKSPIDEPVRPLEPGEPSVRPLEPGSRSPVQRELDELPVRPLEPGSRTRGQRPDEVYVKPLEPGEPPLRPLETGSRGQRSDDILGPVDLGADPRKMGAMRRTPTEMLASRERTKSPLNIRQKEMEAELEKLNKQLSEQVNEITGKKDDEHFEDHFPPSKKVQALREVLEQEYNDNLPPNINDMWARFKERKEQSMSESSLNSTRLDALSGLLQNPTHHDVHSFIKEKKDLSEKQKREEEVKAERLREEQRKLREEQMRERELEKKIAMEKAALERNLRRQEMKNVRGLSEEESNGSYTEILLENEKKREQRRKKGERDAERREKKEERSKSPAKKARTTTKSDKDKERRKRTKEEATVTDIKTRNMSSRHSDTADTLFSIPEDASFEQSPSKAESEMKSRQKRHRHVIDPLMKKLRDKIKMQRDKIDKERRKELQRVEKLKKLEMLLNAKKKGKLSDRAIGVELEDVSTTMSHSESSQVSDSTLTGISTATRESDSSTQDSTTLKDSTAGSTIKLQVKMYPDENYRSPKKHYVESDSTETSDFSNIIVERLPEKKSERRSKDKKSGSSAKKYKVDEYGNKVRKEKKKQVFGVEVTEKDLANQLKRFETYMTPEKERMLRVQNYLTPEKRHIVRDAATMYPSPITVSPPSKRRTREVVMKSEAIQTTPSIRSSSPTHSYDEVPVAPVPYMSRKGRSSKTSRRRPSPSPTRSAQTSFSASPPRKSSSSPTSRKKSRSPGARVSSKSPTSPRRRFSPPITRRQAQSPIWKPESEIFTPPENSMFTPEGDENLAPTSHKMKEAESWFVSMKPSKPWRQPLKERQAFAVRQEAWKPKSIPQSDWKQMMSGDIFKDKGDSNDISRDTKFDLDPEGQPLGDVSGSESEDDLDSRSKPLSKMSLQEAFQVRKGEVISRLRERQKRLNLAAEQRKMEAYLKMERDQLFQEERKKEANPDAHPYSAHLHMPVRRVISKEEMKEMTQKKYKKLPEVIERQKLKKRQDEYSLNRIKARLFNRKIQKKVLVKAEKWGR